MAECGLQVFDGAGRLARSVQVQVPEPIDPSTLDLIHKQFLASGTVSYAVVDQGFKVRAIFLHHQIVPPNAIVTSIRRRSPGGWVTGTVDLPLDAGGRGAVGPEVFFRQVDLDLDRAWLATWLMRLGTRYSSRTLRVGDGELYGWETRGERFFYRSSGPQWQVYGAGNTPLLRLEQAAHLAAPETVEDYLWAVGAIPLGKR